MGRAAETRCLTVAVVCFGLASVLLSVMYGRESSNFLMISAGLFEFILTMSGIAAVDIYLSRPADSYSLKGILMMYLISKVSMISLWKKLRSSRKEDIKTQQDQILKSILKLQADTVYGKERDFAAISDRNEFREKVTLNSYKDLEPYINRMADDGEENVLTVDKLLGLSTSSGTTGKSKRIPYVGRFRTESSPNILPVLRIAELRHSDRRMGRVLELRYKAKVTLSKAGYETAPLTYHLNKQQPKGIALSPEEVGNEVDNEDAALYCHAVFGFIEREVSDIQANLSTLGHAFWRLCEQMYMDICDDIANGTLKRCPNLTPEIRVKLESHLEPMPDRAEQVRGEFEKGNDCLQLRIWPDCKRSVMLTTGGFAAHAKLLADSYMKGVHFSSLAHSSSEAICGVNLSTETDVHDYSFVRGNIFFELIPEENLQDENPKTVFLDEAQVGESYEMVLTTTMGLYRYRLGDVVKIKGRFFSTPLYEFQYRIGQMLNVYWEKTPENLFYAALCKSLKELDIALRDYTSCEDFVLRDAIKGMELPEQKHYVLFIELIGDKILPAGSLKTFDDKLKEEFDIYRNLRYNGSIDQMVVVQVRSDSFKQVKDLLIKDTQNLQFKMPRVLRRLEALQILQDNRVIH